MFPFILGVPAVAAAASDLTMYVAGAALFGTGGLLGYIWARPDDNPQSSPYASTREYTHLNQAEMLQTRTRKSRKRVLESIGEEAIEELERVLDEAHKARLKLGSLNSDFSAKTLEMEKTTQTLTALIDTLNEGNKTTTQTIVNLSSEIELLKKTLLDTRKKFGKTISKFLRRTKELEMVIGNFECLRKELESTQCEYHEQIMYLTKSLENASGQLNLQSTHQINQDEHIQELQEKVEKLTQSLQVVTEKGEAYAQALSRSRLKNQRQLIEINKLHALSGDIPEEAPKVESKNGFSGSFF